MRRRNLFLPDDLMDEVKALAVKRERPMADVIRLAVEAYVRAVKRADAAKLAEIGAKNASK